jgi:CheY-like chemotaxis protein
MAPSNTLPSASCDSTGPTAPRRILIVEDNPDSRNTLRVLLELWGHQVEVAEDGVCGVEKALAWRPNAAVVDIGLPSLNGYELAQEVRAALGSQILLIALTGYSQYHDRRRALEAGFDHFMTKPADLDQLSQLLTAWN